MEVFTEYLLQNWALILVLLAFAIMLNVTVFLDQKMILRMYILIISVFLLSIIVFTEFYLTDINQHPEIRLVMMAIRYSATPLIVAMILYALVKRAHWAVFVPAALLIVFNVVSIFTGIVFSLDKDGNLVRGVLGYLPYIATGIYLFFLIFILIKQSNKHLAEIIPIAFLALSFISGLVFPLVIGKNYSRIFCTTIAVSLFVYYVFLILQLTKKDPLTGLLNRQAYYSMTSSNNKDITALLSIDMNGLKRINDNEGHLAGDKALVELSHCLTRATNSRQLAFRIGGDEFVIICYKTSEQEVKDLIERINTNVGTTKYSCSVGYSYVSDGSKTIDKMLTESDGMMYIEKSNHYKENNISK